MPATGLRSQTSDTIPSMKKRTIAALLGLLVVADAGLYVAYLKRGREDVSAGNAAAAPKSAESSVSTPPAGGAGQPAGAQLWERLHGEDARHYATRLRASGMPDRLARLLVGETLRVEYLAKQRELIGSGEPAAFWKDAATAADREKQTALRQLARQHQDLVGELYGAGDDVVANRERLTRLYGPLSDEKLERVDRIHADYGDMAEDIRAQAGGLLLATDRETLALLDQERRKDVAAILTAEELERYDQQTTTMARTLRARLAAFAPTEKEFRALFKLHREFEERCGSPNGAPDDGKQRERSAAEAELDTRIKAALGDARYAEYRQQQDSAYRVAARIAERFGLPASRASEVFALSRATQSKLQALRDDTKLGPAAVREALATLAREADARLTALLGDDGAELYKRTSSGAWLRALERATSEPEPKIEPVASPKNDAAPEIAAPAGQGTVAAATGAQS